MSRRNRIIIDGGKYHIINKINEEKMLLGPEEVKKLFLEVIKQAKFLKKFKFVLKNITIMNNHIHMIIKMHHGENLSKLMQWIFSVFAMRYNRMFKRKGHLWISRFVSKVIESMSVYRKVFEYVCNNPVKAGISDAVEEYKYGYFMLLKDRRFGCIFEAD